MLFFFTRNRGLTLVIDSLHGRPQLIIQRPTKPLHLFPTLSRQLILWVTRNSVWQTMEHNPTQHNFCQLLRLSVDTNFVWRRKGGMTWPPLRYVAASVIANATKLAGRARFLVHLCIFSSIWWCLVHVKEITKTSLPPLGSDSDRISVWRTETTLKFIVPLRMVTTRLRGCLSEII